MKPTTDRGTQRSKSGRATVTRTFTLYPEQDLKLIEAEKIRAGKEHNVSVSLILQDLIDHGLDLDTGRAKTYLAARDRAIEFEEDVLALLDAAGFAMERHVKVNGGDHHADIVVTHGKKRAILELKSSGKRDRLELALGQALIMRNTSRLPVCVVVPVILDSSVSEVYKMAGVGLVEAGSLAGWLRGQ